MQQKCGMLINNVNNVKRWFYEKENYYLVNSSCCPLLGCVCRNMGI
jgi:hypothetical protein